jgi:hypothetical protein
MTFKISEVIQIPNSLIDGSHMPIDFTEEDLKQNLVRFCIGNDPLKVYCIDLDRLSIVVDAMIKLRSNLVKEK